VNAGKYNQKSEDRSFVGCATCCTREPAATKSAWAKKVFAHPTSVLCLLSSVIIVALAQAVYADSARDSTSEGNKFYKQGNFNEAINSYDQALTEAPGALEPKFNQANSYYRLDDLSKALDLYRQVAAESKDMKLVAKSKYNLGNTYFQQGSKQKDSNLQKAIDDMKTAISSWRGVLDIEPENKKAAKNIEVARLTIKDLLDQLNKQQKQQDANQPQDPNQQQKQSQQQQNSQKNQNQAQNQKNQQQSAGQDPNQPKEPNEPQDQQKEQKKEEQKQQVVPDTTAQQILDNEQRQRKNRQILQRGPWQKVEKDW
jgi:Ca-activated chloride channel family protein